MRMKVSRPNVRRLIVWQTQGDLLDGIQTTDRMHRRGRQGSQQTFDHLTSQSSVIGNQDAQTTTQRCSVLQTRAHACEVRMNCTGTADSKASRAMTIEIAVVAGLRK